MQARLLFLHIFIFLPFCLSCASPRFAVDHAVGPVSKSPSTKTIIPAQIVPSIHDLPAPPILGVNYIETIGRPGQGAGQFLGPSGLDFDHRGLLYVADSGNNRVQVVEPEGDFIMEFGKRGWRTGEFDSPTDVAINFQRTELLYVADTDNDRIQYCNLVDRIFHLMVGSRSEPGASDGDTNIEIGLDLPSGIGIGRNGEVYVVDTGNNRFIRFNAEGIPVLAQGSFGGSREQLRDPTDLVADARGNVYIVDSGNHRIKKYDFSGNLVKIWGTKGTAHGQFREPTRIALDRWNYLYVTDRGNQRIQIFTEDGKPVMIFSSEVLIDPVGIAISRGDRIFVSDFATNDIKVFQIIYILDSE